MGGYKGGGAKGTKLGECKGRRAGALVPNKPPGETLTT